MHGEKGRLADSGRAGLWQQPLMAAGPPGFLADLFVQLPVPALGVGLAQADGRKLRLLWEQQIPGALTDKAGLDAPLVVLQGVQTADQRPDFQGQAAACLPEEVTIAVGLLFQHATGAVHPDDPLQPERVVADIEVIRILGNAKFPEIHPAGQRTDSLDILQGNINIPALAAGFLLRGTFGAKSDSPSFIARQAPLGAPEAMVSCRGADSPAGSG